MTQTKLEYYETTISEYLIQHSYEPCITDTSKLIPLYVCKDQITNIKFGDPKYVSGKSPSYVITFWALYEDKLLFAVTGYGLGLFETLYDDHWNVITPDGEKYFDFITPKEPELKKLLVLDPTYYVFDMSILDVIPGNFCQFEIELITKWNRDFKLNLLLK